jgi:hypothetical protein
MQLAKETADVKIANLQTQSHINILRTFANCLLPIGLVEDIGIEPMTPSLQS